MTSLRFNSPSEWRYSNNVNPAFLGFLELCLWLSKEVVPGGSMIEIGSYMGESTMLFSSTGLFNTVYSIDPHSGNEEFNSLYNYDWNYIKQEFNTNTRFSDNIKYLQEYSYNVYHYFKDGSIDFIYIDGDHTYESVQKDLNFYLPKLKKGGIIGGHDYYDIAWPEVCRAVDEYVGKPDIVFSDTSWVKVF